MKTIFRTRACLIAAVSGLALIGALAIGGAQTLSAASALAAAGPASSHGVHPMANYGNIYNDVSQNCLGTNAGHNNTYTVIWACNGTKNQSWTTGPAISYQGNTYVMIKNENGDCLGLQGGHVTQGTPVVAWTCNSRARNQYWAHLWQLGLGDPPQDMWVLCNLLQPCQGLDTGRVAGVASGSVANGAKVVLWDNNGAQNQIWDCASACNP